jgi:alanyl-tRNA synthetase
MKTDDIRKTFLEYFKDRGHEVVPSSSLIPVNDPTLLFVNAGMVPFKDVFLGKEKRSYSKAVSVQRCMRVSGKHNDLDQVGFTARHHTFFEMLGNFSFGAYFKREAIKYAWEFLTQVLKIPVEKLWITVYEDDAEAADIWLKELGVSSERFSYCGAKDNFWAMGETGPCGPCSEIFYDHGPEISGGPPGSTDEDGDRYVEIWNLVFMQYSRDKDGSLNSLPNPSIDTGMGLERVAAVMQGVHSNYDIDIFVALINAAAKLTKCKDHNNPSLKVLADHIRACSFLIADGVIPSNEGRGYVLRRIIRRAIRYGNKLGVEEPFFYKLVGSLVEVMGGAYPELIKSKKFIEDTLLREEEQFAVTLSHGLDILEKSIASLKSKIIPGKLTFKLYDTYGFPLDLTEVIARERGFTLDKKEFEKEMKVQRERSQSASKFEIDYRDVLDGHHKTEFVGYDDLSCEARVITLVQNIELPENLALVVLDRTSFYPESGGQIGDAGTIETKKGKFEVDFAYKNGDAIVHQGRFVKGAFQNGDLVVAKVNEKKRKEIVANHTATHLLHAALKKVLGDRVAQKGSLVNAQQLRFDFSHSKPVSQKELQQVEGLVDEKIRANLVVVTQTMSVDEAKAEGATALFGEKYGDQVRVVKANDFSMELCGGIHVKNTGEIRRFKIISESGVAAGIRRIIALTNQAVLDFETEKLKEKEGKENRSLKQLQELNEKIIAFKNTLDDVSADELEQSLRKIAIPVVKNKVEQLQNEIKEKEKILGLYKVRYFADLDKSKVDLFKQHGDVVLYAQIVRDIGSKETRDLLDRLKDKLEKAIVVLINIKDDDTISLIVGVTKNCIDQFNAGELVKLIAEQLGGKGGGRADMAQGGGKDLSKLPVAMASIDKWMKDKV